MTGIASLAFSAAMLVLAANRPNQSDSREEVARAFFAAAKYQEAIDIYSQLFARYLHPDYIYNIGRCYQNMGDPDKALQSFHEFSRKSKHLDSSLRQELDGHIKEMEALKAQRELVGSKLGAAGAGESTAQSSPRAVAPHDDDRPLAKPGAAKPELSPSEAADGFLAHVREAPEKFWRERALVVEQDKLDKTVALVNKAKASDRRLAEYQFYLATQYAGRHFTLRLRELQIGAQHGQESHKVTSGERKLGPEISSTFTSAVEYYLAASKKKDFAKMDEALMGLAILLQANNMEPRARNVLLQLLRNFPDSKLSAAIRAASRAE
jgi:tetratricopeptide (TPR) repeat protein